MTNPFVQPIVSNRPAGRPSPAVDDRDSVLFADCPELIGTPFAYAREEEIYGEGEDEEFVYRVVAGAVRSTAQSRPPLPLIQSICDRSRASVDRAGVL